MTTLPNLEKRARQIRGLLDGRPPVAVRSDDSLDMALQAMLWGRVRHLPVVDGQRLVGVLSQREVLGYHVRVGARLAARAPVKEIMSVPPITVGPDDTVASSVERMVQNRVGCLPVVDAGKLLGVVTRTDLLTLHVSPPDTLHADLPAARIMKTDVHTAKAEDHLMDAVARMEARGIRHLPVVDGDRKVIGILSDRDVRTAFGDSLRALRPGDARVRLEALRVGDVMTHNALTVGPEQGLAELASSFVDHRVGALPVVGPSGTLVGIISYVDVLAALAPGRGAAAHAAE